MRAQREEAGESEPRRPVEVTIRGGTYTLREPLWLGPQDSGSRDFPVTWTAAEGEQVVLTGAVKVTGWERWRGAVYRAPLPERADWHGNRLPRQLFYKGDRQRRSRWPKYDPKNPVTGGWIYPEDAVAEHEYQALIWPAGAFPRRWARAADAEANIYGGWGWSNTIIPVLSIEHEARILRLEHPPINQDEQPWYTKHRLNSMNRFFVENVLDEVTEPGDWCCDTRERMLYFLPPEDGFDQEAVSVPAADCLVRMRDTAWVTLRGLTLTCTTTGDDYHRQGVAGLGAMTHQQGWRYCGEALHIRGSRYCTIEECLFDKVGGNAVYIERDNYRTAVRRCEISGAGFNGVVLAGDRVKHPQFCEVTDNDIHDVGRLINYVAGVSLGISDSTWIAHNFIHDVPHHAVCLGSNGLGRNYVEWNEIRRPCSEISESGAINAWGDVPFPWVEPDAERSGHVIRWNLIADPACPQLEGEAGLWSTESRGMFLDDYTSNCLVWGNIFLRMGTAIVFHGGKHNVAENNIFIGCHNQLLEVSDPVTSRTGHGPMIGWNVGNRFCRNIAVFDSPGARILRFIASRVETGQYLDSSIGQMDGNLYFQKTGAPYVYALVVGSAKTWEEIQKIIPYEERQREGFDRDAVFADPLFVDPAEEDFRLRPESPAALIGFAPIDTEMMGIRKTSGARERGAG